MLKRASPLISVVVPAYNTAKYIGETLSSVFAQTVQPAEVIVVNDGDPDTPALERALAPWMDRIQYIRNSVNQGPSATRNAGIRAARFEYVALVDSDDIWLPHYLETHIAYLHSNPEVDVVYGDAEIFGERVHARRFMDLSPSEGPVTFETVVRQQCTVMISVLGRKCAFLEAGMFDPEIRTSEDFDLWLRMLKHGFRIGYHHTAVMRYRTRFESLSSDRVRLIRSAIHVLNKLRQQYELTPAEELAVKDQIRIFESQHRLNEAKQALLQGEFETAAQHLNGANQVMRSFRLSVISVLMRLSPHLLSRIYRTR